MRNAETHSLRKPVNQCSDTINWCFDVAKEPCLRVSINKRQDFNALSGSINKEVVNKFSDSLSLADQLRQQPWTKFLTSISLSVVPIW